MSRDWTPKELQKASAAMKAAGHMSYEEFCENIPKDYPYKIYNPNGRLVCQGTSRYSPEIELHMLSHGYTIKLNGKRLTKKEITAKG